MAASRGVGDGAGGAVGSRGGEGHVLAGGDRAGVVSEVDRPARNVRGGDRGRVGLRLAGAHRRRRCRDGGGSDARVDCQGQRLRGRHRDRVRISHAHGEGVGPADRGGATQIPTARVKHQTRRQRTRCHGPAIRSRPARRLQHRIGIRHTHRPIRHRRRRYPHRDTCTDTEYRIGYLTQIRGRRARDVELNAARRTAIKDCIGDVLPSHPVPPIEDVAPIQVTVVQRNRSEWITHSLQLYKLPCAIETGGPNGI